MKKQTNKQTKRKHEYESDLCSNEHYLSNSDNKAWKNSCSKFFKDSRLHFFRFSPKIWLTGKKKSYIVFSFYLNLMDYPKQTVTTPSTQLEKKHKERPTDKGKKEEEKEKQGPK